MKAGRCGSCEGASEGTGKGKDRGTKAVRPILGTMEGQEAGETTEGDREMAERLAGEELDKEERTERGDNEGEEAEKS